MCHVFVLCFTLERLDWTYLYLIIMDRLRNRRFCNFIQNLSSFPTNIEIANAVGSEIEWYMHVI